MTVAILVSIISACGSIAAAIISQHNRNAIQMVHVDINSRLTQLLALTASSARAEGAAEVTAKFDRPPLLPTGG